MTEVIVEFTSPGLNVRLRTYQKQALRKRIFKALCSQMWGRLPRLDVAVIVYERTGRVMDTDNVYGSAKLWIDAIVRMGVVPDDDPEHLRLICRSVAGRQSQTKIQIYDPVEFTNLFPDASDHPGGISDS